MNTRTSPVSVRRAYKYRATYSLSGAIVVRDVWAIDLESATDQADRMREDREELIQVEPMEVTPQIRNDHAE